MKKPVIVLLDVDGVLADWESGYRKITGMSTHEVATSGDKELWHENWDLVIQNKIFENLNMLPDARRLLGNLGLLMWTGGIYEVELCTSAGGDKHYAEVSRQKRQWIQQNNIGIDTVHVTRSWENKIDCRRGNDFDWILIDDTIRNIKHFEENGGIGVFHTSTDNTLNQLNKILQIST